MQRGPHRSLLLPIAAASFLTLPSFLQASDTLNRIDKASGKLFEQLRPSIQGKRLTVAVLPLRTSEGSVTALGRLFADGLQDEVARDKGLRAVDRDHLCTMVEEMKLSLTGFTDQGNALRLGRMLEARFMLVGRLETVDRDTILVRAQLLETETGAILASARAQLDANDALRELRDKDAEETACGGKAASAPPPTVTFEPEKPVPVVQKAGASGFRLAAEIPYQTVNNFAAYKGDIYAAVGGPSGPKGAVYKREGDGWKRVFASDMSHIHSLAVYRGLLYASGGGGYGGSQGSGIYVFDGNTWSLSTSLPYDNVTALIEYQGALYAGTSHHAGVVYRFDGASWTPAFESGEAEIRSFAVFNGKLYAGSAGSPDRRAKVFVFDGKRWTVSAEVEQSHVMTLAAYKGKLYAATASTGADIYEFDGKTWRRTFRFPLPEKHLYRLVEFEGTLLVSGTGGEGPTPGRVYAFDGKDWSVFFQADAEDLVALALVSGRLLAGSDAGFPKTGARIYEYTGR